MNIWFLGATTLLFAVAPCAYIVVRGSLLEALVGIELIATLMALVLLLLAEGYHRNSYYTLPLVLAFTNFVGTLIFLRFFADRQR